MHIGFDAKRAFNNFTGLGNYSRFCIEILKEYYPQNQYYLYTPNFGKASNFTKKEDNIKIKTPQGLYKYIPSLWRSLGIANIAERDRLNIYHGLTGELPLGMKGLKTIVTIHDLLFLRYPNLYPRTDRYIYKQKVLHACKNADKIIAVSRQTQEDIINILKVNPKKTDVVYQGVNKSFLEETPVECLNKTREKYKLPDLYILYVGTIEERKNLLSALKALKLIKQPVNLVAVGKSTQYIKKVEKYIQENNLEDRVMFLQNVDNKYLPAIYKMAQLFVYPSIFEGFGIPILEALHSGVPVITSKGSCFSEPGGPCSVYVKPCNTEEMAEAMESVLNNVSLRKHMIERGLSYAKRFDGKILAKELVNIYESI